MSASSLSTVLHVTQEWLMAPTKSRLFSGPQALSDLVSARFSAVISCNVQSYKPVLQPKPQYILLFPKQGSSVPASATLLMLFPLS